MLSKVRIQSAKLLVLRFGNQKLLSIFAFHFRYLPLTEYSTERKSIMSHKYFELLEKDYDETREKHPNFKAGDTVAVHVKIKEGGKERIQVFQGTVIQRRNQGNGETFTVRKISSGIGVERIFPLISPNIEKIELIRQGKVRRARLFYLRGRKGKSARIKERRMISKKA